ncbi:MAG: hydroxymethylbilane synthase [Candidatus Melainabacteria bacterium GWF2_37_15]|nr:MAG: hydroxymethylbilane synthase [Candidatus Melainabacteria bacterium GWF2_37_15]
MKQRVTVGTRGSKLALTQTGMVVQALKDMHKGLEIDIKVIKTTGDKILDKELSKIGGKGLFIKEIEEALLDGSIDFAVHSMKDVPHTLPEDFEIGAILKREDPRDVLIYKKLPDNAVIGTSSVRRMLQLKALYPDFQFKPVRGNIDTRIRKLLEGEFDAIVLAVAGIKRLGWNKGEDLSINYLEIEDFIPSVGQGALALEVRKGDSEIFNIVKVLNDEKDATCVRAERAFLREIDGGCEIPVGAYSRIIDNKLIIDGFIGDEKNAKIYKEKITGEVESFEELGVQLAKNCISSRRRAGG